MDQTHSAYSITHPQYQIDPSNESLKQGQIPSQLNSSQIEQLFSRIESHAAKLNESEANQLKNKVLTHTKVETPAPAKVDVSHIAKTMNAAAFNSQVTEANIKNFIDRGGRIILWGGNEFTNDIAIKPLGWAAESSPEFIVRNPAVKPSTDTKVETPARAKVDISHIAKTMNAASSNPQVSEANINSFIDRGGRIEILEEGKPVKLNKTDSFIVGCTAGVNRSQVARAVLLKNGCQVLAPLAGGGSRMNPAAACALFGSLYMFDKKQAFKQACGYDKVPQLGAIELEATDDLNTHEQWFKNFFNKLPAQPHHFLCFASSGPSVILRLLDKPGDLSSYKVTIIPWSDEIAHSPDGIEPCSAEAYKAYFDKLSRNLIIS
jgi:carbon monoxide dehydrogenase subunit G